jgi:hypothetical protein
MTTSDVDAWIAATSNPKKDVIVTVSALIMSNSRIEEAITWRAPAFLHGGIMAYFHWSAKEFASLIFPLGSHIPGDFELLTGNGLQRAVRFVNVEEVEEHRDELLDIVDAWCATVAGR